MTPLKPGDSSDRETMRIRNCTATLVGLLLVVSTAGAQAAEPTKVVAVECAAGQTIAKALTGGDERKPLRVVLRGVCNEHVIVDRSDVTLVADMPGSGVHGPDPAADVIRVTGTRVAIEGLTVTGGRNGVAAHGAAGLTVRNTVVQFTGLNGIFYGFGASGIVDGCTLQNNARDGMTIESASATVVNSTLSQNGRVGIIVFGNGAARIGVDNSNVPAGNVISNNASTGIAVASGSNANIAMTQITGNGASATAPLGRFGVSVNQANADLIGGNTISNNAGPGVNVRSSAVSFGTVVVPGVSPVNTISGNGFATPSTPFGVVGFMGASLLIQNAVISSNPVGLVLILRSNAQIQNTTVQSSTSSDGIRLASGSGLFIAMPKSTLSGNATWGLNCLDPESSVVNANPTFLNFSGNGLGDVFPGCTGF